jgi:hypothetical protein
MVSISGTILLAVGLNPYRQHRRRTSDYVMVAAGLTAALLLVAWAFLG